MANFEINRQLYYIQKYNERIFAWMEFKKYFEIWEDEEAEEQNNDDSVQKYQRWQNGEKNISPC